MDQLLVTGLEHPRLLASPGYGADREDLLGLPVESIIKVGQALSRCQPKN